MTLATPEQKATKQVVPTPQKEKVVEKVYQVYKSSLDNQRIAMPSGKIINVTAGQYITANEEEIKFLDHEISLGFPYLQKVDSIVSSDLDPMASLKKRIIAEYLAEQAAIEDGSKVPEINVLGDSKQQKLTPASTDALKRLAAGSTSAAGPTA